MKKDAYIAITAIIIFTLMNVIGGLINDSLGYSYGLDRVFESTPLLIIFSFFYWLTSLWKIRLRTSLRLPIIRTIFWIIISIPLFRNSDSAMAAGDFIDAAIPSFCFLTNTIGIQLNDISWLSDLRFNLWGIMILGVSIYQFITLEISTVIINKVVESNNAYSNRLQENYDIKYGTEKLQK